MTEWDADHLMLLCSFETNRNMSQPSPWCDMFLEGEILTWEYARDVRSYHAYGYGMNLCS